MSKRKRKKLALFNKYSTNLQHIKSFLDFHFGLVSRIYICPLSFKYYTQKVLENDSEDMLTFEHAPPEKLGGKIVALTAKDLNSQSGSDIDWKAKEYIKIQDFNKGLIHMPFKGSFKINKDISLNGSISLNESLNNFMFHLWAPTMHPGAQKFFEIFKQQQKFEAVFTLPNHKRPDPVLLRTAYLIAFSELGYSFLFGGSYYLNPSIQRIRHQIIGKEKDLILNIPIIEENFPDEFLGVNIIYEPKEIRSLLVVFDLKSDKSTYRYGVILPGPDKYGFTAYEKLEKIGIKKVDLTVFYFPRKLNLGDYKDSIYYLEAWKELNGVT